MDEVVIKVSKTKMLLGMIGSMAFVFIGIYLWSIAGKQTHYPPAYIKSVVLATWFFFGLGFVFLFYKLFDTTPGLIVNSKGFVFAGGEMIKWNDITSIKVHEVKKTKLILIFVSNPEYYIASAGKFKRPAMKFGEKLYGTPLTIAAASLQCSFQELLNLIETSKIQYSK
jgi:hypothetical protein